MESILHGLLAVLGLGFLVFIHELGHFLVARRQGMTVEAFSIGFGKPLYIWEKNGVKWMICMLPFGGYVKIAGMQKEGDQELSEISNGFYSKTPWQRIQVAVAGPLVNVLFAFLAFSILWMAGGRERSFAYFTKQVGWVDPSSALYQSGLRPGDYIESINQRPFQGLRDLKIASILTPSSFRVEGYRIDDATGKKIEFDYTLTGKGKPIHPFKPGTILPASYLNYDPAQEKIFVSSPLSASGILPHDRVVWADGEKLFSVQQLNQLLSQSTAWVTAKRGEKIVQVKVPRIHIEDVKMTSFEKAEVGDWQYEIGLKGALQDLYYIPYNLSPDCVVESALSFIDEKRGQELCEECHLASSLDSLLEGDQIIAIDHQPVSKPYEILERLQTRRVLVIVERLGQLNTLEWPNVDSPAVPRTALQRLVDSIGTGDASERGFFHLLNPVVPKKADEILGQTNEPKPEGGMSKEASSNPDKLFLGFLPVDRPVIYNPGPSQLCKEVISDTWMSLRSLFSGEAKAKQLTGPIGIVQVVYQQSMMGLKEGLFWLGLISLSLAIFNLLPIPALDGGYILLSLIEIIARKPFRSKTIEKLFVPFVTLLIGFFIYVTYQDIVRLLLF